MATAKPRPARPAGAARPARPAEAARPGQANRSATAPARTGKPYGRVVEGRAAPARAPRTVTEQTLGVRLAKRMSEIGMASRREADEWIVKGWVRVDGVVVSELGSRVMPGQQITIDPRARGEQAGRVTVLLNKPVGYVSGQAEDGHEPARVLVTPENHWRGDASGLRLKREHLKSLVPAGRLDIDSVGLLVLTQDGRIAKQLIGADSEIEKEYVVRVAMANGTNNQLSPAKLALLNHGLELDGEKLRRAQVSWLNDDQLRFVLKEGKKRQIRRMCEAVGLKVLRLKRVRIGRVVLGDLPVGRWRFLRPDEHFGFEGTPE